MYKDDFRGGIFCLALWCSSSSSVATIGADIECARGIGGGPGLGLSGLPLLLDARERALSCGGRGDIGTFHRFVSSGNSSSES